MKILKLVTVEREIEVEVCAEDIARAIADDPEREKSCLLGINNFAAFARSIPDLVIEGMTEGLRKTIAAFLQQQATRFQPKRFLPRADAPPAESRWLPIETAPKDGTSVDLWFSGQFPGRMTGCFWGKPDHSCAEAGEYCDSDWHGADPGWVDSTFGEFIETTPTHWMPLPPAPVKTGVEES